jgi:tetratricopeptide (TPR) repeat protein
MRRLALLAVLVGLCGCSSRSGSPPPAEQASDQMPTGEVMRDDSSTPTEHRVSKASVGSYIGPHDDSFQKLSGGVKADLERAERQIHDGQLGMAVQTLSLLIGENPKNSLAFVLRGEANAERHNDADALADFSTAVELEPQNPERLSARGFFCLSRGNTTDALADFNRAIAIDPQNARARNNRGMARLTSGDVKQAIEDFDACLKINPKMVAAYNNRSFALAKSDRRQEALADLNRAIELDPNAPGTYDNRGALLLQAQEYKQAAADFTRAIELDSYNGNYYVHRRTAWLKLEKLAEAQADTVQIESLARLSRINQAVFRDAHAPQPYIDRGNYFLDVNQLDSALANFNRALELDAKNALALTQRSRTWLRKGDAQKALDDASAALEIARREETYGVRGDAYRKLRQYDKAIADYDAAQRIDQDVAETWTLYAQSLQQAGRTHDADEALQRAAALKALNAPTPVAATAKSRS